MTPDPSAGLARNRAELERRLREVQPAARVVRERHLRRLVGLLADDGDPVAFHPDQPLWIGHDRLLELNVLREVHVGPGPARLLLLVDAGDRLPAIRPDADVLRDYWRALVRAEVFDRCDATAAEVTDRFAGLPPAAVRELRFVLETDYLTPPAADAATVFQVFASVVADRLLFSSGSLHEFFPTLPDPAAVQSWLETSLGLRLGEVAARLRPAGSADPEPAGAEPDADTDPPLSPDSDADLAGRAASLTRRAKRAGAVGNHVRAAILRTRAAGVLTGPARDHALARARSAVHDGLVARLAKVLGWDYPTARRWTRALVPLLDPAATGVWSRAARTLYDLQKIPTDLERDLYTVDPVEWLRSFGRRPLRRPLTRARNVILLRHLASADGHFARIRLPAAERDRLHALLRAEIARAEAAVRADLGPAIHRVLDDVGLRPASLMERVSRDKLVAELLDRACEKGYLRLSDFRDAVARNQLKMPDLSGAVEFVRGDALLRADERLAVELDGVYHRGEIYLRWVQRLTAAGFGTRTGRWLSRYVLLPFGGGVMTVEFAKYVSHEVRGVWAWLTRVAPAPDPTVPDPWWEEIDNPNFPADGGDEPRRSLEDAADAARSVEHEAALGPGSVTAALLLGVVYLGLIHVRPFRVAVGSGLLAVWQTVRWAVVDLPTRLWQSPPVRAIRRHPVARFVSRRFGSGLLVGGVTAGVMLALGFGPRAVARWAGLAFAAVAGFVNTSVGREAEERVAEGLSDAWRELRANLIPGVIGLVMGAFRWLAGVVERALYSVDEWLRFRAGQSEGSLFLKAVFAAAWFPVAYLTRFAFYLLFEPQINPLKHFPVVTVSHKLLLPMVPSVASATGLTEGTAFLVIAGIPGVFGFVAWELKENWRLYAANRPVVAPPAVLGHHGETMRGLLRPGFHSGTVPKLYGRLRRAIRDAETTGRPAALGRWEHELEEIAAAVAATAERDLIPLLASAGCWAAGPPAVGGVRVGVQAIEIGFTLPGASGPPLRLAFEHADGRITARVDAVGWAVGLSPQQQTVLGVGLGGLAELCAATWLPDEELVAAAPGLAAELRPRPWEHRMRYWEAGQSR